ncbi:MAG: polyprenol phosphomannose-dependent alpha 1,6 mannosyltransferase MptB [Micrococcales bacterium]|nr:polyprenol phosphomannose-dependent alpha 1,6 mannosyltransferase MptB [Micrococcales bacterium]
MTQVDHGSSEDAHAGASVTRGPGLIRGRGVRWRDLSRRAGAALRAATATFGADLRAAWALTYVRHGMWGMLLLALGAMTPAFLPPDLWLLDSLGLQWLEDGGSRVLGTGLILGGVALVLHAWLRLRPTDTADTAPASTWLLWSLPILLAPPLFSRDAYSYAAQGLIVDRGMDPYTTGPISVPGEFADNVDPVWLYTPAPYGPLALQVQHLVVDCTLGNAYVAAVAMRIPALIAVGILALALPRLARRLGRSDRGALWLGVLNPLVLMHLVGGNHNDAMMIALVAVALLFATRGWIVAAALTIAVAAGFKQTAVLALIGVAGLAAASVAAKAQATREGRPDPTAATSPGSASAASATVTPNAPVTSTAPTAPKSRGAGVAATPGAGSRRARFLTLGSGVALGPYLVQAVRVGLVSLVGFTVISAVSGLGWGWLQNLSVPMQMRSLLAPTTFLGSAGNVLLTWLNVDPQIAAMPVPVMQSVGAFIAVATIVWLTVAVAPAHPVGAAAGAFAIVTVCGPVVQPWYVLPVLALVGASAASRRSVQLAVWVTIVLTGYSAFDVALSNGVVVVGIAMVVYAVARLVRSRTDLVDAPLGPQPDAAGARR